MKKTLMRFLSATLFLATLCVAIQPAYAASPGTYYAQNGSPSSGIVCEVTTKVTSKAIKPYYDSQTEHRKGIPTTIGVSSGFSSSYSVSASLSATVGASYMGITASATASAGVSESVTYTTTINRSWTINENIPDGLYRVETVFPQFSTRIRIYRYTLTSTTTVVDKTIVLADKTDSYLRLYRYANCG